jgi:hypothetical protein
MADPKQLASLLSEEEELRRFNAMQGDQPWYSKALPMEGRATFLPFRDTMEGSVFNKRELALPGILAGALNAFTSPARALTGSDPTFKPGEEAANMALNTFGGGIATGKALTNPTGMGGKDLALNVYHGTPHEIKGGFDISKVGTGEGAQAYGHGIYFAEAKPVAEQYAKQLGSSILSVDGKPVDFSNPTHLASLIVADPRHANMSKESLASAIQYNPQGIVPIGAEKYSDEIIKSLLKNDLPVLTNTKGNLYKTDIPDAAIPMMLDYDSPIKNQPQLYEIVRQSITDPDIRKTFEFNAEKGITGANVYKNYIVGKTDAERSANAAKLGITGIRYLDEGSRGTGKGTSNYVVFDPSTVKILEKNDIPVSRKELLQQEFDKLDK